MADYIVYSRIPESKVSEAAAFMVDNFVRKENTQIRLDLLQGTGWIPPTQKGLELYIKDGLSLMAIDQRNGNLAGVMIAHRESEKSAKIRKDAIIEICKVSPRWSLLVDLANFIWNGEKIENVVKTNNIVNIYAIGVSSDYLKMGIGYELISRGCQLALESGFDAIFSYLTHAATIKIFQRLQFTTYVTKKLSDFHYEGKTDTGDDLDLAVVYKYLGAELENGCHVQTLPRNP